MITRTTIRQACQQLGKPGLATKRACERSDVFRAIREARNAKKRVRVYSSMGFVPNSYRHRCSIQYVEVWCDGQEWHITVAWTGAQRSFGKGNLVVVQ